MKIYELGEQTFAVIDGELWTKVRSTPPVEITTISIDPLKQKPTAARSSQPGKLTPEQRQNVIAEYKDGHSATILAEKYGITAAMVYYYVKGVQKQTRKSKEPLKISVSPRKYICPNGHRFITKLPRSHARCPSCGALEAQDDVGKPVTET